MRASVLDSATTLRAQLAGGGLILLVVGGLGYLWFLGFLGFQCFDSCGTAEEYANRVLQAAAFALVPGVLLTGAAFALLLRQWRRMGRLRASRVALSGATVF